MVENLSLLVYTNSKCSDLHEGYLKRVHTFFPSMEKIYVTSNQIIENVNFIEYTEESLHFEQMIKALDCIQTDYVLYNQEDYILFDYVFEDKIKKYLEVLDKDSSISFIRLIYSGIETSNIQYYDDELFYLDSNSSYFYSTQATLWRKEDLKSMFKESKVSSIFDEKKNSFYLRNLNKVGLCTTLKGDKIGGHFNSLVYPYIATALVKGKWNLCEYEKELKVFLEEFNINKEDRGVFNNI